MERESDVPTETKHKSDRFERGLTALLKNTYTPVDSRPEFKDELLEKLRVRQAELASERRAKQRRRAVIRLGVSALAASLFIAVGISLRMSSDGSSPAYDLAVSAPPSLVEPISLAPSEDAWTAVVSGVVEARSGGGWARIEQITPTASETLLRIPDGESGAVHFAPGATLEMDGGTVVALSTDDIRVRRGNVKVDVFPGATPVSVAMGERSFTVDPGGRIVAGRPDDAEQADGRRPLVALIRGRAFLHEDGAVEALRTGLAYRFADDRTQSATIPELLGTDDAPLDGAVPVRWLRER